MIKIVIIKKVAVLIIIKIIQIWFEIWTIIIHWKKEILVQKTEEIEEKKGMLRKYEELEIYLAGELE